MTSKQLSAFAQPETEGLSLLKNVVERPSLSARAYGRILKVSRTIADLGGGEQTESEHLVETISYQNLDRENWAGQCYEEQSYNERKPPYHTPSYLVIIWNDRIQRLCTNFAQ